MGLRSPKGPSSKFDHTRRIAVERLVFLTAILSSLLALGLGAYIARRSCEPHWMNRAGSAVVVFQAVAGIAEFARRRRLELLRAHKNLQNQAPLLPETRRLALEAKAQDLLEMEAGRAEFHAVAIVLVLAAIGELFHGFGDLIFQLF